MKCEKYDQMKTASELRRLRIKNGFTQEEVAQRLYRTRYFVGHMESGKFIHHITDLENFAEIYGQIKATDLMYPEEGEIGDE